MQLTASLCAAAFLIGAEAPPDNEDSFGANNSVEVRLVDKTKRLNLVRLTLVLSPKGRFRDIMSFPVTEDEVFRLLQKEGRKKVYYLNVKIDQGKETSSAMLHEAIAGLVKAIAPLGRVVITIQFDE